MKKLLKKMATMLTALMLCVMMCTGCSVLELDSYKYYHKTVVVTVGDINFYMNDLITAFNNYGYQYYENNGYSMEEAIKATATSMVERELLLREVIKESKTNPAFALTDEDEAYIREQAFTHIQDQINSFEEKIRKEMDVDKSVVEGEEVDEEEEEGLRPAKKDYSATIRYIDGALVRVPKTVTYASVDKEDVPMHFEQIITDEEISSEAMTRYLKGLQDNAKAEGRDTSESAVLLHEEERLISILTKNRYLEKFENYFLNNLAIDYASVVEHYKTQYLAQKALFDEDEAAYHEAMKKYTSDHVYYHPNSGNEYVNINHILIKFTKDQTTRIANLENLGYKKGTDAYKAKVAEIAAETTSTFVDEDGNEVTRSAEYVYNTVVNYVNQATTAKSKARRFEEMMYRFNDDEGNMNADFYYVVNLDTSVEDQMVKEFADTARSLHKNTAVGSVSEMIITEYGYHILFNAGAVKNITADIDSLTFEDLFSNYTSLSENKDMFNYLFDKLALDGDAYTNRTLEILGNINSALVANGTTIKYYEYRYENLWK